MSFSPESNLDKNNQPAKRVSLGEVEPFGLVRLIFVPKMDKGYLHLGTARPISRIEPSEFRDHQREIRYDQNGQVVGVEFAHISSGFEFGHLPLPKELQVQLSQAAFRNGYIAWDDVGLVLIHDEEEAKIWELDDDDVTGIGHARMILQLRRLGFITGPTYKERLVAAREEKRKQKSNSEQ